MPQDQDLCFQPPSRLEASHTDANEEEANCDHQSQSCSDSLPPLRRRMEFSEATTAGMNSNINDRPRERMGCLR
jgi:hypothetical protein